jgi:glutaminase
LVKTQADYRNRAIASLLESYGGIYWDPAEACRSRPARALGTFAPPLDRAGNSVKGQLVAGFLSRALGLSLFTSEAVASPDKVFHVPR